MNIKSTKAYYKLFTIGYVGGTMSKINLINKTDFYIHASNSTIACLYHFDGKFVFEYLSPNFLFFSLSLSLSLQVNNIPHSIWIQNMENLALTYTK